MRLTVSNKNYLEMFWSFVDEKPAASLLLIAGFSLITKAILIAQADIINPDGIRYINSAYEAMQWNFSAAMAHERMLGFTFILGLFHLVIPDWYLAGKILSCTSLLLATVPLYLITRELFGARAAILTACVFSVAPTVNGKCASVIKDPLFLLIVLVVVYLVMQALKRSAWKLSLLAAMLTTFSMTIRPEGIVLFLVIAVYLVITFLVKKDNRKGAFHSTAAFLVIPVLGLVFVAFTMVAGVLPLEVASQFVGKISSYFHGQFSTNYLKIYDHLKDVEENFPGGDWTNDFFEYARYNIYLIYLIGMLQTYCKSLSLVFVVPLFFGFHLKGFWKNNLFFFLLIYISFLGVDYLFLLKNNFLASRYLLVPVVLGFVLVGHGLNRLSSYLNPNRQAVLILLLFLGLGFPLGKSFHGVAQEKREIKAAGEWLKDNMSVNHLKLLVSEERIAFYAGLMRNGYTAINSEKIKNVERKAMANDFDVIVLYIDKAELEKPWDFATYTFAEKFVGEDKAVIVFEKNKT